MKRLKFFLIMMLFQTASVAMTINLQKPVSLDFQDIEVRAVLRTLAELVGINLVMNDGVQGHVTLHLKNVPWQQALDVILTTKGLDKQQMGNVLLVDNANAMAKRAKSMLKEQQAAEQLLPIRQTLLQIKYAKAVDIALMLKDKSNSLLSERGALSVDVRTNSIWLQDTLAQIRQIKSLITRLDIPVKQVEIEARIVSMNKECAIDLGARLGITATSGISGTLAGANQLANAALPNTIAVPDRLNLDLAALPLDASPVSLGIALAKLGNHALLDLELSALESEGRAQIIASPRLITTNQQAAMIESGEDIPYQESTLSGATAVSFKKAVLSLKVTPQITPDGKLLMALMINHDSDSGRRVQGVPIIITKSIETNVLVNHGQTIVLGGIYKQDKNKMVAQVPFLGSLPVVGYLFSRKQTQIRNEELLIFITPRIITNDLLMASVEK